jgi:hypothetical protein
MTRTEMIEAIYWLSRGEGRESDQIRVIKALDQAAPGSRITDMIYPPDKSRTPEEIVDTALARVGTWNDD